jgi:hypothetical protein
MHTWHVLQWRVLSAVHSCHITHLAEGDRVHSSCRPCPASQPESSGASTQILYTFCLYKLACSLQAGINVVSCQLIEVLLHGPSGPVFNQVSWSL